MKRLAFTAAAAVLAMTAGACADTATAPRSPMAAAATVAFQQSPPKGSGLALDIVPNVTLLGQSGSITVDQAIITNFALIENTVGQIIGLQATGDLSGTAFSVAGNVLGATVQPFTANVSVTSSGPGQCSLVTLNLTGLSVDALKIANAQLPATVTVKGSGAVGSLLCNLGSLLSGLTSGLTGSPGAQGVVNALNNQIG